MEEIIELGFNRLVEVINLHDSSIDAYSEEIRTLDAELLGKMAAQVTGVIAKPVSNFLKRERKTTTVRSMIPDIIRKDDNLGKSADPMPYRPDNMSRAVQDQFCLLGEDGNSMRSCTVLMI